MTEGVATKMKRNGARTFKNPPQPHMCIQDFIKGSTAPCYVNVLSWDKVEMPHRPSLPVPLYGGMKVPPPRTKTDAVVFAVMANPEILRISGKNAQDPKKRLSFIELLLDFIEAMNAGIVFSRHYTILKDRDITGELKEVWNAVLAIRDSEQRPPQQETWIDAHPSISQYPQYPEQQQQQEYTPQPPQYHSSIAYGRNISSEGMHYDNYGHQPQSPMIPQNEQIYQPGQIVPQQYHGNDPRLAIDHYYREHGKGGPIMPGIPQQSCPAYPTAYQFQQLPRQMMPQYVNSNMHPNTNLAYGPAANTSSAINSPYQSYIPYQQQQQQQQQPPRMDNTMHVEIRRMQQQYQQQQQLQSQMHLNHVQQQYEQLRPFNTNRKPHMGIVQKNNVTKRQVNSPTHTSCGGNCPTKEDQSGTKPKSPVKVLQRETPIERQDKIINHMENNKAPAEKTEELKIISTTNFNEDPKKNNESENNSTDMLTKKEDVEHLESICIVDNTAPCEKSSARVEKVSPETTKEIEVPATQQPTAHTKSNKFGRRNIRTGRTLMTKNDQKHNSFASESPKRSQPKMNSIIKSVFKINPGVSGEEGISGKRKTNGQTKANAKATCDNEDIQPGYTILKKDVQEEIVSEIAQISIQDCKDTTEVVGPVLS